MAVGIILLAAGQSRRFGSDKRLAEFCPAHSQTSNSDAHSATSAKPSTTVFNATLQQAISSGLPVFVVLRPGDNALIQQLEQQNIDWGVCPDAHRGMGHSLAFAVRATQHWSGWLIALADMPWLQAETYQLIASQLNGNNIVRPYYLDAKGNKENGNPVAFSRPYAFELMQCHGDHGARHIVKKYSHQLSTIQVSMAVIKDIDHPKDIQQ